MLMFAVREAMNELAVRLLARRPSSLHETTTSNYTVLMAACEGGNGAMIRHLVEQGAKLNVVDDDNGYSALMYLARSTDEHPSIARMMVARGASLSAKVLPLRMLAVLRFLSNFYRVFCVVIDRAHSLIGQPSICASSTTI